MIAELFSTEIAEVQEIQLELNQLDIDRDATIEKIEKIKAELRQKRKRLEELENILKNASKLIIENKLSENEFSDNKRQVTALNQEVLEKDALLGIYEKTIDVDFAKRQTELNNKFQYKRNRLNRKYAENLCREIANNSNQEIRELFALLPSLHGDQMNFQPNMHLGFWLAAAIYGGSHDSPKLPSPDEKKLLIKAIHEKMGV
jgi:hypothetical protein